MSNQYVDLLRSEPIFWSTFGWAYNPIRFRNDGSQIVFYDYDEGIRRHRQMFEAGVRIHSTITSSGWIAHDQYDYTETDRVVGGVCSISPEIRCLPRIKLDVPPDWGKHHPEGILVYSDGPRDLEGIRNTVGTLQQDILGYITKGGYYGGRVKSDDRPNVGGIVANQSPVSKEWIAEASEALRRVIRHLEDSPWGKQIIGYHLAFGCCGENVMPGGFNCSQGYETYGDYGIAATNLFRERLIAKYGPSGLNGMLDVPPIEMRYRQPDGSARNCFRFDPEEKICMEYDEFLNDSTAAAIESFCRTAKEESGKAAGAFYGYYLWLYRAAYSGHLAYDKILNSPWVDFIAAPKGYYCCKPGEPGCEQVISQSINRKKIFIDEIDNGTWLGRPEFDRQGTFQMHWREFAKNQMNGSGYWWMDLGGGWFESPEIHDFFRKTNQVAAELRSMKKESCAQVLMVSSDKAFFCAYPNEPLHKATLCELPARMRLTGTPIDHYRLSDLETLDLSKYKFILFLNCWEIGTQEQEWIFKRTDPAVTLMFIYADGFFRNGSGSPENLAQLTGIRVQEVSSGNGAYPFYDIVSGAEVRCCAPRFGKTFFNGRRILYSGEPLMTTEFLRKQMEDAGVEFPAPLRCTVYADNRFTAFFNSEDMTFQLKNAGDYLNAVTGTPAEKEIRMIGNDYRFFIRKH